jgi:esterase/lipase superfamily enzyme
MAADEDDDAFEYDHKLKLLPRLCKRANVYFNREDKAMSISDVTKGNPDRLGDDGPRSALLVPAKVTQIDCSQVVTGPIEHSYYKDTKEVVKDMAEVLSGIQPKDINNRQFNPEGRQYELAHKP